MLKVSYVAALVAILAVHLVGDQMSSRWVLAIEAVAGTWLVVVLLNGIRSHGSSH